MIGLTETESKIFELISKGTKNTPALMLRTGFGRRTVTLAIRKLIDNRMVETVGSGRSITYQAIKKGA